VNIYKAAVTWSHSCIITKHFYVHLQEIPICHSISQSVLLAVSVVHSWYSWTVVGTGGT
jgi:hypothetical protein